LTVIPHDIDSTGCDWYTQWVGREGSLLRRRGVLLLVALALVASACDDSDDTATTEATGGQAKIDNLTLDATPGTIGPGASLVELHDIPIEQIWAANDDGEEDPSPDDTTFEREAVATPLGAIDLGASPLGAIPLGAIPRDAIGLDSTPLGAILLSSLPLKEGRWEEHLAGISELEGKPLQAITLAEALQEEAVLDADLTIAGVSLEGSPLGAISVVSLALGDTPLGAIELKCPVAPEGLDCDPNSTTVLELELASAPLGAIPLGAIRLETIGTADAPLGAIPLGAIPLGAIPLGAINLGELPLRAIPAESAATQPAPLGAIPLGAIPLGAIELGHIPLGAIPAMATPLGAIEIGELPLGAIPLGAIDTSATELETSPLGAIPLGAIDVGGGSFCEWWDASSPPADCATLEVDDDSELHSLAAALEGVGSSLEVSPLGAINLDAVPLGAIPLGAIPLGAIPLGAIDLVDTPLGAIRLGAIDIDPDACTLVGCDALGLTNGDSLHKLAVELEKTGSSIADTPLGAIDVDTVPLGAIPLGAIVLDTIPLGAIGTSAAKLNRTPLGAILLRTIDVGGDFCGWLLAKTNTQCSTLEITDADTLYDLAVTLEAADSSLANTPLGAITADAVRLDAIPLGAIPLGAIPPGAIDLSTSPLGAIPLGAIPNADDVVNCTLVNCDVKPTDTLADAQIAGAIGDAFLSDLGLGLLFGYDLIKDHDNYAGLTLGHLLVGLMIQSDYPWEELPFEELGVQDFAESPNLVTYTASFDLTGSGPPRWVEIEVTLPVGSRYRAETSTFGEADSPATTNEPAIAGNSTQVLTWVVEASPGVADQQLQFQAASSLTLGTGTADVEATLVGDGASATRPDTAPVTVEDTVEGTVPDLPNDTWVLSYITTVDDEDTFLVPSAEEDSRVTVFVGNPAIDVDLVAYRPSAEPEPTARPAPLGAIAVEDDGPNFRQEGDLETEAVGDILQEEDPTTAGVSTNRDVANEELSVSQRGGLEASEYTIQITGYNDATSNDPYRVRRKTRSEVPTPTCPPRSILPDPGSGSIDFSSLPPDLESLFLYSPYRLDAIYGPESADKVLDGTDGDLNQGLNHLITYLNRSDTGFAPAKVISVDDDNAVRDAFEAADMNPCDPFAANDAAAAIRDIVLQAAELRPTLRFVTIIGSDDVIPMWRLADHTELANEAHFAPTFRDDEDALYGAMVTRHYLSDSPYFDLDPIPMLDRHLYVPELAGGRLVEGVDDILLQIDTFIGFDGVLDPQTGFAAGYDFLSDGTDQVADHLDTNLGKPGCDEDENESCPTTRFDESWNAADLKNAINADHGILSPNAHYDYYRALPASEFAAGTEKNLFEVGDITDMALGSIVFTMGCHAGLNVVALGSGVDDFAQAYAGQGASYLANTGYGYGDTEIVDLSEELMANFALFLDGSLTLGQADVASRQRFFADQAMFTPYHEKSLQEVVLYGLPMYQIGGDPVAPDVEERRPTTIDPVTGLDSTVVELAPEFNKEQGPKGTHYSVGEDGETQGVHDRPIQPFTSADITQDGLVASGAVFESLTTSDVTLDGDPAFFRPVIDLTGNEPELEAIDVMFPTAFLAISTFNVPSAGEDRVELRQQLNVIAGQYLGDGETQRLFDEFEARVYYAPGETDDFTPPHIALVGASIIGAQVSFRVDTDADAERVLVLYHDELAPTGEWGAADLVRQPDGPWSGGGPVTPGATLAEYLVQVVDAAGNTSVSTFKGEFYDAEVPEDPPMTETLTVTLTPDAGADPWATGPVKVTVTPAAGAIATVDGRPRDIDKAGSFTIDADGAHTVHLSAGGEAATFAVAIDTSNPEIGIGIPAEGAVYELGATIAADFVCSDAGSGVVTCDGDVADGSAIATARLGEHEFTVTATDVVGNRTETTHTYEIVEAALIEHTVVPGEFLRRIAAAILEERDQRKPSSADIAKFWPLIYEANRAVIGDDPDLILPGQLLKIPEDD
jgi:nucleoid-associated protein YgaU